MKYLSIVKYAIQNEIAYKASYWGSLFGIILKICVTFFLWKAIYLNNGTVGNYSLNQMLIYVLLSTLLMQMNTFSAGRTFSLMIARGEISVELVKPYNLITKLIFYNIGTKIVDFFKYVIPLLIVSLCIIKVHFGYSILNIVYFILSCIIGFFTIQFFDILISMLAFFTTNTWGLWILRNSIVTIFSGSLLPLNLFPEWFVKIASFLPFQSAIYQPINILFSNNFEVVIYNVVKQLLWCIFLFVIVYVSYNKVVKHVQILGG